METIFVVGAGLVGSVLSIYLSRLGYDVHLFDRFPDFRNSKASAGKSINLTICGRGFASLDRIGAGDLVRSISVPCYGRVVHGLDGSVEFQPYSNHGDAIYSVSRNNLNRALLALALEQPNVRCHFEQKCLEVDLDGPTVTMRDLRSGEITHRKADRLFGTDGAYSAVRLRMQRAMRFNFNQEYLDQGYKELNVPASPNGDWIIEGNAIHIWPRGRYMLIGFPNVDHTFTFSLHMPYDEGVPSFASIRTPEDLLALFHGSFPDAVPLLPNLVDDFFRRPEASMVTMRCFPWTYRDKVALVGDAAHAMVPSYGQGANSGFEDCAVLADCLAASDGNWHQALESYQGRRKPNADAMGELALEHFHELRDFVGVPEFLLRKRIERRINELFPDRYQPLYSLISFTSVPYVEALRRDREQRVLVDRVMELPGIRERLDSDEIRGVIESLMSETPFSLAERAEAEASLRPV